MARFGHSQPCPLQGEGVLQLSHWLVTQSRNLKHDSQGSPHSIYTNTMDFGIHLREYTFSCHAGCPVGKASPSPISSRRAEQRLAGGKGAGSVCCIRQHKQHATLALVEDTGHELGDLLGWTQV